MSIIQCTCNCGCNNEFEIPDDLVEGLESFRVSPYLIPEETREIVSNRICPDCSKNIHSKLEDKDYEDDSLEILKE